MECLRLEMKHAGEQEVHAAAVLNTLRLMLSQGAASYLATSTLQQLCSSLYCGAGQGMGGSKRKCVRICTGFRASGGWREMCRI